MLKFTYFQSKLFVIFVKKKEKTYFIKFKLIRTKKSFYVRTFTLILCSAKLKLHEQLKRQKIQI